MSRKHPQNGPSLSKATYTAKPLTEEELARRRANEVARERKLAEKARATAEFSAKLKKSGGSIRLRGPGALDEKTLGVLKRVLALPPKPHDQMKVGRPAKKKRGTKGRASSSKP